MILTTAAERLDFAVRWALIRMLVRTIPAEVDLDDEAAVVHALHQARYVAWEFGPVLDEVISEAKRLREIEALNVLGGA